MALSVDTGLQQPVLQNTQRRPNTSYTQNMPLLLLIYWIDIYTYFFFYACQDVARQKLFLSNGPHMLETEVSSAGFPDRLLDHPGLKLQQNTFVLGSQNDVQNNNNKRTKQREQTQSEVGERGGAGVRKRARLVKQGVQRYCPRCFIIAGNAYIWSLSMLSSATLQCREGARYTALVFYRVSPSSVVHKKKDHRAITAVIVLIANSAHTLCDTRMIYNSRFKPRKK